MSDGVHLQSLFNSLSDVKDHALQCTEDTCVYLYIGFRFTCLLHASMTLLLSVAAVIGRKCNCRQKTPYEDFGHR